mmetsp:Transcript_31641/g.72693  ORF Transcript_31641/g.72693 Transcript_31641/m.72693 type:complete len:525 (-) Transcript_31641:635-2209(-)
MTTSGSRRSSLNPEAMRRPSVRRSSILTESAATESAFGAPGTVPQMSGNTTPNGTTHFNVDLGQEFQEPPLPKGHFKGTSLAPESLLFGLADRVKNVEEENQVLRWELENVKREFRVELDLVEEENATKLGKVEHERDVVSVENLALKSQINSLRAGEAANERWSNMMADFERRMNSKVRVAEELKDSAITANQKLAVLLHSEFVRHVKEEEEALRIKGIPVSKSDTEKALETQVARLYGQLQEARDKNGDLEMKLQLAEKGAKQTAEQTAKLKRDMHCLQERLRAHNLDPTPADPNEEEPPPPKRDRMSFAELSETMRERRQSRETYQRPWRNIDTGGGWARKRLNRPSSAPLVRSVNVSDLKSASQSRVQSPAAGAESPDFTALTRRRGGMLNGNLFEKKNNDDGAIDVSNSSVMRKLNASRKLTPQEDHLIEMLVGGLSDSDGVEKTYFTKQKAPSPVTSPVTSPGVSPVIASKVWTGPSPTPLPSSASKFPSSPLLAKKPLKTTGSKLYTPKSPMTHLCK